MPDLKQLHRHAREIFDHALSSADPRKAVRRAVTINGSIVDIGGARLDVSSAGIYAVAIGKAAPSMAIGLNEALGENLTAGVVTSATTTLDSKRWRSFAGGHPLPNEASLEAARAAFALVDRANSERAVVIFLISGGGSAMIEWPANEDISLADLRTANQVLVACGARISEVNAVRRGFSAVKGGALAKRAPHARLFTLIVSDTNPGDEASVASGPTLLPPTDSPTALGVVEQYQLEAVLPESILRALRRERESDDVIQGSHRVLLDNLTTMKAAAQKASELGYSCAIREEICEQPIAEGCNLLLSSVPAGSGFSEISGGEFSCPVRGDGRGGRNLETVLRCAIQLDQTRDARAGHCVVLSAGTDGIDGNSPAAGAIADETTVERGRQLGLDAEDFLARSDSFGFFERLNDLILTGPTGTNVRDLRIVIEGQDSQEQDRDKGQEQGTGAGS